MAGEIIPELDNPDTIISGELIYYAVTLASEFKSIRVIPIGDVHYGNPLFSARHFNKTLTFVQDNEDVFVILVGDLLESSIRTSKGEIYKQVGSPQDQMNWMIDKLMPIKDRILGMVTGNHENRIWKEVGVDLSRIIANALNVPYRPEGILLKVSFGDWNNSTKNKPYVYWIYTTHGYGGARTASAKAVKLERTANHIHADLYIMGHDHVANAAPIIYLMPDNRTNPDDKSGFHTGKIREHKKKLMKTNAYFKWGGYGEMGGFSPSDLEVPIAHLKGEGKPGVRVLI